MTRTLKIIVAITTMTVAALTAGATPSAATARNGDSAGPWSLQKWTRLSSGHANQGVATVDRPGGGSVVVTRGNASIPPALRRQGWIHIGDPDSRAGYLLDAYQARRGAHTKMFLLTAPNGHTSEYVHRLAPGELFNNSFTAITPDGQWFVSGEWGTLRRLLVFAMPALNRHAPPPSVNLPLAATIALTHPMRNVQGCAFSSPTTLVCSTDDRHTALYGVAQQLLRVQLVRSLDGHDVRATPTLLGAVPHHSTCPGLGETEGLDIHGGRLLLAVPEPWPCNHSTLLYQYNRTVPDHPASTIAPPASRTGPAATADDIDAPVWTPDAVIRTAPDVRRSQTMNG